MKKIDQKEDEMSPEVEQEMQNIYRETLSDQCHQTWQKGPPLEIWVSLLIYCTNKQIVPNVRYHKEAYHACAAQ